MVAGKALVPSGSVSPELLGGLLSVVTPVGVDFAIREGLEYEGALLCGSGLTLADLCTPPATEQKVLDSEGAPWGDADPFGIYYPVACGPFGTDTSEREALARDGLRRTLGPALEADLQRQANETGTLYNEGTAVGVTEALSVLESYPADNGFIQPTFHMSRGAIPYFGSHIRHDGDSGRVFTRQGTRIANGAGYDSVGPVESPQLDAPTGLTATLSPGNSTAMPVDTYYYVVTALDGNGETTVSNEASITTTATTDAVELNWDPVTGAVEYNIYWSNTPGVYDQQGGVATNPPFIHADAVGNPINAPTENTTGSNLMAGPGQFWAYATGPVRAWATDPLVNSVPGDKDNLWISLAEQVAAVTWECGAIAVLVDGSI